MKNMNIDGIEIVMFDLDGAIYYGDKIIPGQMML